MDDRSPTIRRAPAERAQGLDPEVTAQPRPLSEEIHGSVSNDVGLSLDPDELGTRFLIEATEQGGPEPARPAADVELSLVNEAVGDEPLSTPNFEPGNSLWEQTIDLAVQNAGSPQQLRAAAQLSDDERDEEAERESTLPEREPVSVSRSVVRDGSLFDYEDGPDDGTRAPAIEPEDGGRHARNSVRGALGQQVEASPSDSGVHRSAAFAEAEPAADGGGGRVRRAIGSTLVHGASALRVLARRIRSARSR
jgi:hypothetical protein